MFSEMNGDEVDQYVAVHIQKICSFSVLNGSSYVTVFAPLSCICRINHFLSIFSVG